MKGRWIAVIATLGTLGCLMSGGQAFAAASLSVAVEHYPEVVHRNDAFLGLTVTVKNDGDANTSPGLSVSVQLPPGLSLKRASGPSWACSIPLNTCISSATVEAGGTYPVLDLDEVRIGEDVGDEPVVRVVASGGGAASIVGGEHAVRFEPPIPFGISFIEARAVDEHGQDVVQAGGHPFEAYATFEMTKRRGAIAASGLEVPLPVDDLHSGVADLPPGVVGNPEVAQDVCELAELFTGACPESAAVGGVAPFASAQGENPPDRNSPLTEPVYRMVPERGYAASFGFQTIQGVGPSFIVRAKVRSDGEFGITTLIPLVPQEPKFFGAKFAFCGFGARVSHPQFLGCKGPDEEGSTDPFVTLGTSCASGKPRTRVSVDSWVKPGRLAANGLPDRGDPNWHSSDYESPELEGCEQLTEEWVGPKKPTLEMVPEMRSADTPSGYTAKLHISQEGLRDAEGVGTAHLKDTVVTLPEGLTFNPAIADGLEGCSLEQMGYMGNDFPYPNRIRFDTRLPRCPAASKIGNARVRTPLLAETLFGSVYLAAQRDNPFGTNYAIYLAVEAEDVGTVIKLPGKVDLDPSTGRITATFKDNPQLPFEDLELEFFGGDRAPLANPAICGSHVVSSSFSPWSAVNPDHPNEGEIARAESEVEISSGAGGSPCVASAAQRPFAIGLSGGSVVPTAGAKSQFNVRITRPDGSQEFDRLEISPPPGFVASLRGIPYCSEEQIAAAVKAVSGRSEVRSPSCPPASEIGSVEAGVGPGGSPFYVNGKLYLAGPYKGHPLSVVAITPAVAGPYDLGNVVIRSGLRIDPRTARITAVTDRIPRIFEGVPLRIRDIRIKLDRPNWAQNPTNCEPLSVGLLAYGSDGAVEARSSRFQVDGCAALGFKPKMQLRLKGGTTRAKYQQLTATVWARPGDANIGRASVTFPRSIFLAQEHIRTVCTRVQFAADKCPKGSVYGQAEAITPLLDEPLKGPVYLRSSDNLLPDLVAALEGPAHQPIKVELVGRTDSKNRGLRNTFDIVPDAPVTKFTLRMQGGKKSLLVTSRNICKRTERATVKLNGQNGRRHNFRQPLTVVNCKKKAKRKASAKRRRG